MTQEIIHSLLMIVFIGLAFVFPMTPLVKYDLQIIALLFLILFATKRLVKNSRTIESVIFTLVIFLIINTTGGATSQFFFLIYFLLFSLSLMLEPVIAIVTTLASVIFFLVFLPQGTGVNSLLPIFALVFLTPFALYLGREHLKSEILKNKNEEIKTDTFLFHSLVLKKHIKNIQNAAENFLGNKELSEIKNSASEINKLIDKFESSENKTDTQNV